MESLSYKPSLEHALSPMLDLISEDESVSDSFMDDNDGEDYDSRSTCDSRNKSSQTAPFLIVDTVFDGTDDPYLDSSMLDYTSASEDYGTFMDLDNVLLDNIFFPCTASSDDDGGDFPCLSFAQRFESSVKKLKESMKRSSETRKSLVIKTPVIMPPESLSGVIQQVEESSRCLQTTLCKGDFRISA